ncbi:hypothetical protein N9X88_00410 [Alphaproteobacteria bacterium]|nr:hypothetical protein [Alphaproteobacteria bacterium]
MTFSSLIFKMVEKTSSVQSAIQRIAQKRMDEHEVKIMENLCEISDLGHLKEKQLARNEAQLQLLNNTQTDGLVKMSVYVTAVMNQIEPEKEIVNHG